MHYTLVIDQGTHASRAILFDATGHRVEQHSQPIQLNTLDHQHIEQDAGEILQSVHSLIDRLDPQRLQQTRCCALTTQRSTVVAWDKHSGQALYPAISWQDRRSHQALQALADQQARIQRISGLPLSAHYGAGKMRWLLQQVDAVQQARRQQRLCMGPLAGFLLHQLLKQHPCRVDHSNAHRSQLFDISRLDWSAELLELFQIPADVLPECRPVMSDYGELRQHGIPVTAVCGDQTAAVYARGGLDADSALINMGTGAFILSPVDRVMTDSGLLCSVGKSDGEDVDYFLEGTVNGAGAALSWAQQQFPEDDVYSKLAHWLDHYKGPVPIFINTLGGLGSPWWTSGPAPSFLHAGNSPPAAKYLAVVESIAFLLLDNIRAMQALSNIRQLYVSGGLSQLDGLCQRLASLSRLPVIRLAQTEASALGAAWLANRCPADWPRAQPNKIFAPDHRPELMRRYREFNAYIRVC